MEDYVETIEHAGETKNAENVRRFWAEMRAQIRLVGLGQPTLTRSSYDLLWPPQGGRYAWGRSRPEGEREPDGGGTIRARGAGLAVVGSGDFLHKRQPDPRAPCLSRPGLLAAEEALEDAGQVLGRNLPTGVRDRDADGLPVGRRRHGHRRACRCISQRIVEEVPQRLADEVGVRLDQR